MAMYETIFILDSLLSTEEIEKLIKRVKEIIETNDGKVISVDKWGKRRLAYEIQKKQYGFYVAIEFDAGGPLVSLLGNEYNFNDKVLRYLTYRYTINKLKAREKELQTKKGQSENLDIEAHENGTAPEKNEKREKVETGKSKEVDNA